MKMANDSILDKLEKLLAMATSDNPNEAANALAMAQRLMAQHNLTEGMVERNKVGEVHVRSTQSVSRVKDWENSLMWTVCRTFGCKLMFQAGSSHLKDPFGRFIIVGPKLNLKLAEYTATILLKKVVEGRRSLNAILPAWYSRQEKTHELDGYCIGYTSAIREKVHALTNAPELQLAIEDYVKDRTTRENLTVERRSAGRLGYEAGLADGANLELNRPMSGGEQRMLR